MDVARMEGGIELEGPVDERARLVDAVLVEDVDGKVRIGDGIVGILGDGAPERRLRLEGGVALGFQRGGDVAQRGGGGRIGVGRRGLLTGAIAGVGRRRVRCVGGGGLVRRAGRPTSASQTCGANDAQRRRRSDRLNAQADGRTR